MKKLTALLTAAVLIFTFVGCAEKNSAVDKDANEISSVSADNENQSDVSGAAEKGKVLVAYYSATGSTKKVAEIIAGNTSADVFVITPEKEYTSDNLDWTNDKSRVSEEHNDPEKRNVALKTVTPENFGDYKTVFIGYPIWWGIAAWPVDGFVKGNDFTGKTVIPFCTAASSDIGESGKLLENAANGGTWQDGRRFYGSSAENEIKDWLNSIKY